jgi:hypothetical protein
MIYTLARDLMYNPALMNLERLKDETRQVYGQHYKHKTPKTALTAGKFKKKFKGECRICGAKGHKAQDCWDIDKNKSKRPTWYKNPEDRKKGTETTTVTTANPNTTNAATERGDKPKYFCNYCKKAGHTEDRCIIKQRDNGLPHQYPSTIHTDKTVLTANVAFLCYESCLLTVSGQENVNINTFIADSGASAHMVHS